MSFHKRLTGLCAALALVITLSGCYSGNIDQYFSLPRPADEYRQLQTLIDQEIASGCEYASPTRGSYQQSVQFHDLNGDGADEAVVFFRDGDRNLRINVYTPVGKEYRRVLTLSGEGRSIGRVEYSDVDADGLRELIVAWQISGSMSLLSVYSMANWSGELLLSTDSTEFITGDLDGTGRMKLLVLRGVNAEYYMADMYSFSASGEPQAASAALSAGIGELRRMRIITLADRVSALLVESALTNGDLVTDLLVSRDGSLVNMTLNRSSGVSETRRAYSLIYSQDIDDDGVTEVPHPQQLLSPAGEQYWSIAWYRYDSFGRANIVMTTYHCVNDGWYLVLPSGWETGLTVRRDDSVPSERAVTFSRVGSDGVTRDLLTVYTLTGENRSDRARLDGRFVLLEDAATVYAARIMDPDADAAALASRFHRIYSEWSPGSV